MKIMDGYFILLWEASIGGLVNGGARHRLSDAGDPRGRGAQSHIISAPKSSSRKFTLLSWSLCVSLGLMHWRKGKEERQRRVAEISFFVFGSHEEAIMSPKSHKPRQDIAGEVSLSTSD